MSHWYTNLGENRYDSGLREARENNYLPSVTTIDKVIGNPGLEIWKSQQVLLSSLTMTRGEDESDKDFVFRVMTDSRQQARKAAQLGNVIHKLAERYIMGKSLFYHGLREDVWIIFDQVKTWIDEHLEVPDSGFINDEGAEKVLVNQKYGYAGKADFYGWKKPNIPVIIDWKTTFIKQSDVKKNGELKKAKYYPSWLRQLAALQACDNYVPACYSVVISTNPELPGVWSKQWSEDELAKGWKEFKAALILWKSINNYESGNDDL